MFFEDYMGLFDFNKDVVVVDIPMVVITNQRIGVDEEVPFGKVSYIFIISIGMVGISRPEEQCYNRELGFSTTKGHKLPVDIEYLFLHFWMCIQKLKDPFMLQTFSEDVLTFKKYGVYSLKRIHNYNLLIIIFW